MKLKLTFLYLPIVVHGVSEEAVAFRVGASTVIAEAKGHLGVDPPSTREQGKKPSIMFLIQKTKRVTSSAKTRTSALQMSRDRNNKHRLLFGPLKKTSKYTYSTVN